MDTKIKIKIDTGTISTLVANKKVLKLYCFYATLKAYDFKSSGVIDYKTNIKELCEIMNISQRTFYIRLNACIYEEIIKRNETGLIMLVSFIKVAEAFTLNHSREYITILPGEHRLEDQLRAKAIELNLNIQTETVHKKIRESYGTKKISPEQIRLKLCSYLLAAFITGEAIPEMPIHLNPEVTLSQSYTSGLFGCKHQTSGFYWQYNLHQKGLLTVESRKIESKCYANKTKLIGIIGFNPKTKTKFLQLRNQLKPAI